MRVGNGPTDLIIENQINNNLQEIVDSSNIQQNIDLNKDLINKDNQSKNNQNKEIEDKGYKESNSIISKPNDWGKPKIIDIKNEKNELFHTDKKLINKKNLYLIIFTIIIILGIIFICYYIKVMIPKNKMLSKGRKYLDLCLRGDFVNREIITNFTEIKATAIIPVYNCAKFIKQVVRSIQNQKLLSIEIILVNDNSKDNSLSVIQELQKEDSRIKIINNIKNRGTLYSRCIGVLESKGKYIFPLDNDDMFFDDNIFSTITKEAESDNYDIVGFKAIQGGSYDSSIFFMRDSCHMHKKNFTIYQPQLSLFGIQKTGKLKIYDIHIWSKCINGIIYKSAINKLGKDKYTQFIISSEDIVMVFALFNTANSYRYITKYGIFRYARTNSASATMNNEHKLYVQIFFLDIIFNLTKNTFEDKKFAFYKAVQLRNSKSYSALNDVNRKYLNEVLKKLLSSEYIFEEDKKKLKKIFKKHLK